MSNNILLDSMTKRIAVCITGASGAAYAYRFLEEIHNSGIAETHLVVTKPGAMVIKQELGIASKDVEKIADFSYDERNFMSPIASGSFRLDGCLVSPCSMKTLSGIAHGYEENLVIRAASIALKEGWKLVLMPRETPFGIIQIKNMLAAAEAGAIVMPPLPQFYFRPKDINEIIDMTVGKMLSIFGIKSELSKEWGVEMREETEYAKHD
jgi:polyprenyl P-hydroxybenzoate/phenylacrylic acid decarboxylase-like protein